ncbi:hypothetical protein O6H91_18G068400 [Diphasiastrum complanatum]|uniref:Uncharacterized protein n=1 Tax=Diphasiastrum complanatum TaxID=34168 RepID=A0ACC2B2B2_DIPCM|nr:hypothetical protein O6H91_Y428600 [Diphasiastrum complanatum]KAJ7523923.1 hypothetical protein O6H91_18G068400 [Diphasiastrum complanatum]
MANYSSYEPPPLLNIPQWYPLLRSAAAQQNQEDLCTLYSLASTFTFVLCRSILTFPTHPFQALHTPINGPEGEQSDRFTSTLVRILLLRRHLLILIHVRRALRLSRAWHVVVLHRLRSLTRDLEVRQRLVAVGKVSTSIFALLGFTTWIANREGNTLPKSTALATFTSILMAIATAITSTIGHGTNLHLPLFRIEDSMRTMKSIVAEAGLTSWVVSETLVSVEECVNNLLVQCTLLMDALCISLQVQNLELLEHTHHMVRYTESWKMLEKEVNLLEARMQRARRRWERQGSARRYQRSEIYFCHQRISKYFPSIFETLYQWHFRRSLGRTLRTISQLLGLLQMLTLVLTNSKDYFIMFKFKGGL